MTEESSPFPASEKVPGQKASRQAYQGFTGLGDKPAWEADYNALRAEGWTWRVAIYIAWAASPTRDRWPKTEEELAIQVLGLKAARSIQRWKKKNKLIDDRIAHLQAEPLMRHRRDVIDALVEVAKTKEPAAHQDRKLFLFMTGDYKPKGALELSGPDGRPVELDLFAGLEDEELDGIIHNLSKAAGEAGAGLDREEPASEE